MLRWLFNWNGNIIIVVVLKYFENENDFYMFFFSYRKGIVILRWLYLLSCWRRKNDWEVSCRKKVERNIVLWVSWLYVYRMIK